MTTLKQLENTCSLILENYLKKKHSFPLIVSVLNGMQEGFIYTDTNNQNYFIIHKSGFADLIENTKNQDFDKNFYRFLLNKKFPIEKIRWYNVPKKWTKMLKSEENKNIVLVDRAQLVRKSNQLLVHQNTNKNIHLKIINSRHYDSIKKNFGFSPEERFWISKQQFLKSSFGVMCYKNGQLASVCYACALVNSLVEVDVFTSSIYRAQGLTKLCVANFINLCIKKNLRVHWDCYLNNIPSFKLAKSLGFKHYHTYTHAIIQS